jgi:hypothetical protein
MATTPPQKAWSCRRVVFLARSRVGSARAGPAEPFSRRLEPSPMTATATSSTLLDLPSLVLIHQESGRCSKRGPRRCRSSTSL